MKKFILSLTLILTSIMAVSPISAKQPIRILLDGNQLRVTANPVVIKGTTLVPLRDIFEGLGAEVDWNKKTQTIEARRDDQAITLKIDSKKATVNKQTVNLSVPAQIINGKTLVPGRFIAESLGATVNWDEGLRQVIILSNRPLSKPRTVDLNGDGKEDMIKIYARDNSEYGEDYIIQINDSKLHFLTDNIEPEFSIVDIKTGDGFKEVAVSEYGPSDDEQTTFFRYDGEKIISLGQIEGFYGQYPGYPDFRGTIEIDGSGTIKTITRGYVLQTWFYEDTFKLENNEIINAHTGLYIMDTVVTVLQPFTLKESINSWENGITVNRGEVVTLKETDNERWCSIVNSKGQVGWFEIEDHYKVKSLDLSAGEVFEGLCFAD